MMSGSINNFRSENILGSNIPSPIPGGILSALSKPKLEAITWKSISDLGNSSGLCTPKLIPSTVKLYKRNSVSDITFVK